MNTSPNWTNGDHPRRRRKRFPSVQPSFGNPPNQNDDEDADRPHQHSSSAHRLLPFFRAFSWFASRICARSPLVVGWVVKPIITIIIGRPMTPRGRLALGPNGR